MAWHMCNYWPETKGERKEEENRKKILKKIKVEKFKLTDPSSSRDPKHKKHEETIPRYIIIKFLKVSGKEKILKTVMGGGEDTY